MSSFRYCISHVLAIPLTTMARLRQHCNIAQLLNVADKAILLLAVSIGLYTCWDHTRNVATIALAVFGLVILAVCGILYYYFELHSQSSSIMYLLTGCLLGIITFTNLEDGDISLLRTVTDVFLALSVSTKIVWMICERSLGLATYSLLSIEEMFSSIGFAVACLLSSSDHISLWLLVAGFVFVLMTVRLKAFLAFPCIMLFTSLSIGFFFKEVDVPFNYYAIACYAGRLVTEPIGDNLWLRESTVFERWHVLTWVRHSILKLVLLAVMGLEIAFLILSGYAALNHDEWYFAVPAYALFGFLWVSLHIAFFVTCWTFINKFDNCNKLYQHSNQEAHETLGMIMASRGLRFFTLVARRLVLFTLLSSLFLGAVTWQDHNAEFLGAWLAVLPLEVMVHGLLCELGSTLGGTCMGLALVGPSAFCRSDGSAVPVPAASVEEASNRSLRLLHIVQHFFTYHMINVFSCDFSSSGLEQVFMETKMKSFFSETTEDGPRFDTYILYYSGHVYPNGNWALAGDVCLTLETILGWWSKANHDSGSRFIIVQDVNSKGSWMRQVRQISDHFVALQTASVCKSTDPETGVKSGVGDFTRDWVGFNCSTSDNASWKEQGRKVKAIYGVSKPWVDFQFQMPTDDDIEQHWRQNFPQCTHPIIRMLQIPTSMDLCSILSGCLSCFRRWKMKWLPPAVLDTGHGFKLVRS